MKFYLIGGRGRLGQAIAAEYADTEALSLNRSIYEAWSHADASDKVSQYFDKFASERMTVFVASGLLDPRLSQDDLFKINYHLPKNVIDGATKLGIKVITFGTVMEGLLQSKNVYVQTKAALGEYVGRIASATKPAIHLQIHTLYGTGEPSPSMFLGQMLTAIRNNAPFSMTSGRQLREYHHVVDEAKAIRRIAMSAPPGVMNVSHGKPLRLSAIAECVFQALGKNELLHVGDLLEPFEENYEKTLKPTELLQRIEFRDSLPAIVRYMKECYLCRYA